MNKPIKATPELMRALYKADLSSFIEFTFKTLYPNREYKHNWHVDVIADKLMQCYHRKCKRLIINMPPRALKSTCASIAFPAWVLANNPSEQIMCISYGDELVRDFGSHTRTVMTSPKYQAMFPEAQISSRNPSPSQIRTLKGGVRQGISAGGPITGRGADIIVMDDVLKASAINTKERDHINQWYDDNIYQRLNNKKDGVIILVMQRLHEYDLAAHLMEQSDEWELLELRAIAEEDEQYTLSEYGNRVTYARAEGEALHPEMESVEQLNKLKQAVGSYVFAAQYQQAPTADKESLVRAEWFGEYPLDLLNQQKLLNSRQHYQRLGFYPIIQSWDTAGKTEANSDYSVCVTLGVKDKQYYVLDVFRKKLRVAELSQAVELQRELFDADTVVIEDAPISTHLIQALRDRYIPIEAQRPVGSKHTRLSAMSGYIESGLVLLPNEAEWKGDFVAEVTRFPNVRHDDQVDAFTQAMSKAIAMEDDSVWFF